MPCANCPPGTGESASLGDNGIERRCLGCRSLIVEAPPSDDAPIAVAPKPRPMAKAAAPVAHPTDILGAAKARLTELESLIAAADLARPEADRLRRAIAILEPSEPSEPRHLRAVGDS